MWILYTHIYMYIIDICIQSFVEGLVLRARLA